MREVAKQLDLPGAVAPAFNDGRLQLRSAIITRRQDFDDLFNGFDTLKAVSYVASPHLLLDFFNLRRFSKVEIVVGDSLSRQYKEGLASQRLEVIDALARKIDDGGLRILVPQRTIHSKLYILEKTGLFRVINGSLNLTETAQDATRQTNYEWYIDLTPDDPLIPMLIHDYETHANRCSEFMGDLVELLRKPHEVPREEVIQDWVTGAIEKEPAQAGAKLLGELTARALETVDLDTQPVFSIRLPVAPAERRETEKILAKLGVKSVGDVVEVDRNRYLNHVEKTINVPLMAVDVERNQVRLSMDGTIRVINGPLPQPPAINQALSHLERYIETVELGQTIDSRLAKMGLFEAILYFLAAPFANEHMKLMRRSYGVVSGRRGPKFLYLFGRSSNGKSTFFKFALSLLTGQVIEPFQPNYFTKTSLSNISAFGTCFPLAFDDVSKTQQAGFAALKLYWESWWNIDRVLPQIIVSSNNPSLDDWLKTRVKRVDFDVHFTETSTTRIALREIMEESNPLFRWFSTLYLDQLKQQIDPHDDELHIARQVIQDLYSQASRQVPSFFPDQPLEEIHDPGRSIWQDLCNSHSKQVKFRREGQRLIVEFRDDLQRPDLARYDAALPQIVSAERQGRITTIQNPEAFFAWLEMKPPHRWSFLSGLLRH